MHALLGTKSVEGLVVGLGDSPLELTGRGDKDGSSCRRVTGFRW
jgi:hypothetical protein